MFSLKGGVRIEPLRVSPRKGFQEKYKAKYKLVSGTEKHNLVLINISKEQLLKEHLLVEAVTASPERCLRGAGLYEVHIATD